jgi:Ribosomal protein L23
MGIIIKPIVTEKMTQLGDKLNRYGFRVQKDANKIEIKQAIEAMYDVTVNEVNTMVVAPKKKSRFTKVVLSKVVHRRTKKLSLH